MTDCPLVMIEWEDSAQPIPEWQLLSEMEKPSVVKCVSVGWLVHDADEVKALAPNMGEVDSETNIQASGVIRIPARCIVKITELQEPDGQLAAATE